MGGGTRQPGAEARNAVPARRERLKLWQYLAVAIVVHIVLFIAFSPSIFSSEDVSPEGMVKKARDLVAESKQTAKPEEAIRKLEDALKIYETVMNKKPPLPAVFDEAEKEMADVRRKMLEQQRVSAGGEQPAGGAQAPGGTQPGKTGPGAGPAKGPGGTTKPAGTGPGAGGGEQPGGGGTTQPPTKLPPLPGLEGDM